MNNQRFDTTKAVAVYLSLQALGGGAWWLMQLLVPSAHSRFWSGEVSAGVIRSFAVADLAVFVGGSAVAAVLVFCRSKFARPAVWLVLGGTAYAWLFCLAQWLATGNAILAVTLMTGAVIGTTFAAVGTR